MSEFLNSVISGSFTLGSLGSYLGDFMKSAESNSIIAFITGVLGTIGVYVLLAVGIIELLYGRKFLNLQKFILSAVAGYYVGIVVVSPIINGIFAFPDTLCGLTIALVAAVNSKLIYNVALYGGAAFLSYLLLFANDVLPFTLPTEGNLVLTLIGVAVVVFVMFLARKNIDRVLTSFIGAFCITTAVKSFYDYTAIAPGSEAVINIAVIVLLSAFGFWFQYRRRKRYY